jgi:hypothetical protein
MSEGGEPESHLQIKIYRPNQLYPIFTVTVQIRKWRQLVIRGESSTHLSLRTGGK